MTTNYEQGRAAEYAAIRALEKEGFIAIRTAGSHSPVDILAWNDKEIRFIQIKTFRDRLGLYTKDIAALGAIPLPANSTAELWIKQYGKKGWHAIMFLRTTKDG